MNANERYYRKTMQAIGCTMLIFLLILNVFSVLYLGFTLLLEMLGVSQVTGTVLMQLFYGAGYLMSFMLPVLFLRWMLKMKDVVCRPMYFAPRLNRHLPLILMAGIAIVFAMASVNASIMNIFSYSEFSEDILWGTSSTPPATYELILQFIVMCLVPGVCEEFLFRGAILTNCLPFGRTNAILISSLLFSLMHQNGEQILYAFAAGVVLGIVYERTGSIWCCTVLHVMNNFASVAEGTLITRLYESGWSDFAAVLFESVVLMLGIVSTCILVVRFFSKKVTLEDGFFGRSVPASDSYATHPISAKRAAKLFLTPSMLLFLIFCAVQILLLILLAVLYVG